MTFNPNDYTKPPFTNGVMTLSNDECVKVKTKCQEIKDAYEYDPNYPAPSPLYVISNYNESNNYQEGINGDTYEVIERYDPELNTQGISPEYSDGIVPEPTPEPEPEPEEGEGEEVTPEPTPEPEQQPETEEEEEIQGA
jgi:hypothetical protein